MEASRSLPHAAELALCSHPDPVIRGRSKRRREDVEQQVAVKRSTHELCFMFLRRILKAPLTRLKNQRCRKQSWLHQNSFEYSKEARPLASSHDAVIES